MSSSRFESNKILKKTKLGQPDVYPQDQKQKEDELTSVNVKQGFINPLPFSNEYQSARQFRSIDRNKISNSFMNILCMKSRLNTYQDAGKKRPQITKEHFNQFTIQNAKSRNHLYDWFRNLTGSTPLTTMVQKKVPIFHKKDDIFYTLAEYEIPVVKATWFIKMTAAYNLAQTDAKLKKRANIDSFTDWTQAICKFLRDALAKLNAENPNPSTGVPVSGMDQQYHHDRSHDDPMCQITTLLHAQKPTDRYTLEKCVRYTSDLANHMYSEGLLDRHEFLTWVVDEFEAIPMFDYYALIQFTPFILLYSKEITMNQLLARKFMFAASSHLNWIFIDDTPPPSPTPSPSLAGSSGGVISTDINTGNLQQPPQIKLENHNEAVGGGGGGTTPQQPASAAITTTTTMTASNYFVDTMQFANVSSHEELEESVHAELKRRCPPPLLNVAYVLASSVKSIILLCPGAAVWYPPLEDNLPGSPLDILPCPPSLLLTPAISKDDDDMLADDDVSTKRFLRCREKEIKKRSRAAESRWNEHEESVAGLTIKRVLSALETLDKQTYERGEPLEHMYTKIFGSNPINGGKDAAAATAAMPASPPPETHMTTESEEAVINLLCEWAITDKRMGVHRTFIVVKLLELRQQHYRKLNNPTTTTSTTTKMEDTTTIDHNHNTSDESQDQVGGASPSQPHFQHLLYNFLQHHAPYLSNVDDKEELKSFENLVLLYSELINHEIFSHHLYLNTLVTKGEFSAENIAILPTYGSNDVPCSNHFNMNEQSSTNPFGSSGASLLGGNKLDKDANDLVLHLGLDPSGMESSGLDHLDPFATSDSRGAGTDRHFTDAVRPVTDPTSSSTLNNSGNNMKLKSNQQSCQLWGYGEPRHAQYVMHFPIYVEDDDESSDWNQRLMILYGAGRRRTEVKKSVKKICKHLVKLIKGKRQLQTAESDGGTSSHIPWTPGSVSSSGNPSSQGPRGGGSRSRGRGGRTASMMATKSELISKFQTLSYFDRHVLTACGATALLAAFNNYISERSTYLPRSDIIILLFDLMEESLDISSLLHCCVEIFHLIKRLTTASSLKCDNSTTPSSGTKDHTDRLWYFAELTRTLVAILRYYRICLILETDLALSTFASSWTLTRPTSHQSISNTAQLNSSEKSVLVLLNDLYNFPFIKAKFSDKFQPFANKIRSIVAQCIQVKPANSNCRYDPKFLREYIENPTMESPLVVAQMHSEKLGDAANRYSFVCSVITTICGMDEDLEKVNALSTLCAEINARCPELSSEWLGVLQALCYSHTSYYSDVQMRVQASDSKIRDPLALFLAILISRNCISIGNFIMHVAMRSLLGCSNRAAGSSTTYETGARLTCHLLIRLFKSPFIGASVCSDEDALGLLSSADRHLLSVEHDHIALGAVLAVLKGMLKLGEVSHQKASSFQQSDVDIIGGLFTPMDIVDFDEIGVSSPPSANNNTSQSNRRNGGSRSSSGGSADVERKVSEFAKQSVRDLCSQRWVCERSLKDPVMDLLMDNVLTKEQRRNLIQLLCYPDSELERLKELDGDANAYVVNILSDMDRWSLRKRVLELQVLMRQPDEQRTVADQIAKATVEVFQRHQRQSMSLADMTTSSDVGGGRWFCGSELDHSNQWLIAPLISKLPSLVQGTVLQEASAILEAPQNWSHSNHGVSPTITSTPSQTRSGSRGTSEYRSFPSCSSDDMNGVGATDGSSLLNNQAFLILILTCLKGQDDQRDSLLDSLRSQITMLLTEWQSSRLKDQPATSNTVLHDGLKLRLSLVGGMFDTVEQNTTWTSDVVVLLTRLISYGIVDIQVNPELFNTVFDMIAMLLHHTLGGDKPNRADGNKREYTNIVKKMKKEMGERQSDSLKRLRQLLPVPRGENYVLCYEPLGGSIVGPDAVKTPIPIPPDSKQGLQVTTKTKVNPWELIEGIKQPAPLCYSWFGAKKIDKKVAYYEEEHMKLRHHEHGPIQKVDYFLVPPDVPAEIEEIPSPFIPTTSTTAVTNTQQQTVNEKTNCQTQQQQQNIQQQATGNLQLGNQQMKQQQLPQHMPATIVRGAPLPSGAQIEMPKRPAVKNKAPGPKRGQRKKPRLDPKETATSQPQIVQRDGRTVIVRQHPGSIRSLVTGPGGSGTITDHGASGGLTSARIVQTPYTTTTMGGAVATGVLPQKANYMPRQQRINKPPTHKLVSNQPQLQSTGGQQVNYGGGGGGQQNYQYQTQQTTSLMDRTKQNPSSKNILRDLIHKKQITQNQYNLSSQPQHVPNKNNVVNYQRMNQIPQQVLQTPTGSGGYFQTGGQQQSGQQQQSTVVQRTHQTNRTYTTQQRFTPVQGISYTQQNQQIVQQQPQYIDQQQQQPQQSYRIMQSSYQQQQQPNTNPTQPMISMQQTPTGQQQQQYVTTGRQGQVTRIATQQQQQPQQQQQQQVLNASGGYQLINNQATSRMGQQRIVLNPSQTSRLMNAQQYGQQINTAQQQQQQQSGQIMNMRTTNMGPPF